MAFVQAFINTYEALKKKALLLGSRPYNPIYISMGGTKPLLLKRLSNGTTDNLATDGSVNSQEFYIQPIAGETWYLSRWMMYIQDSKGFSVATLGSNGALTNGLEIIQESQGVQNTLLDYAIKTNGDISATSYDTRVDTYGNDFDILVARWSFYKTGQLIRLRGSHNEKLIVKVQDDLSNIQKININIQGYKG